MTNQNFSASVTLALQMTEQQILDIKRFHETCEDGEGYDVPADQMKGLASLGLIRPLKLSRYEFTAVGDALIKSLTSRGDKEAEQEVKVVGYLRADTQGNPEWEDDCVCADPVYPNYPGDESVSMPVVRQADHLAQIERVQYKADLYDEVWQAARDLGFMNVTMVLCEIQTLRARVTELERIEGFEKWYVDAIAASNEFGYAGTSAENVIRLQGAEVERLNASIAELETAQGEAVSFVRRLCASAEGQPRVGAGYLRDILNVLEGQAKPATAKVDERAEFEGVIGTTDLNRLPSGEYQNGYVQSTWEGWQARAKLGGAKPLQTPNLGSEL